MEQTNNIITAIQEKPGTSHVSAAPVPQDRTQPKKRARAFFALIIFIALVVGFFGAFLYDAYGHAFFLFCIFSRALRTFCLSRISIATTILFVW